MARIASLAILGLVVGCSGGSTTSTGTIETTREGAGAARDTPGATRDKPPAAQDIPPPSTDPGASGNGAVSQCLPCGKYACSGTQNNQTFRQDFELKATASGGACQFDQVLFACGGNLYVVGQTAVVGSWTRDANGVVTIKAEGTEVSCTLK